MTRSWWENEDILTRFREWLSRTGQEAAALERHERGGPTLLDDAEFVDEPRWLDERAEDDAGEHDPADEPAPELPSVGLIELIEAFTALRHETKLQTKGSRGLEDSLQSALQGLNSAIRQFETVRSREEEAAARAAKPFAEALANLDESLARGAEAIAASHRQAAQAVPRQLRDALDERFQELSWWRRRLSRSWHRQVQTACQNELSAAMNESLNRVMEGYGLIQARLRRVMQEQGIERIACVGKPADAARMTVVELVDDTDAAPGSVLEEVRPGYTYRGSVIRFAEVRAARQRDIARPDTEHEIV
ncbi:MAG: nucleotide exchange factor GrpE [Planctomycetota bacterium]